MVRLLGSRYTVSLCAFSLRVVSRRVVSLRAVSLRSLAGSLFRYMAVSCSSLSIRLFHSSSLEALRGTYVFSNSASLLGTLVMPVSSVIRGSAGFSSFTFAFSRGTAVREECCP